MSIQPIKPNANAVTNSSTSTVKSNITVASFIRPRTATLPFNDWPVIEILSHGIAERQVERHNGEVESIIYNRSYFSVPRGASSADEVYRLSTRAFTPELWGALEAVQSDIIPTKGTPPGFDVIVSCLLEGGAVSVVSHEETAALANLRMEFNQSQSSIDTDDLDTIRDILNKDLLVSRGLERSKKRIPAKVWDDTGIAVLGPATGYPSYYIATIAIMSCLVKQRSVNPGHAAKMQSTISRHYRRMSSKYRMSKACLDAARRLSWGPGD